ncbi:MAG: threonine/serine dehydratase [Alphaproteobacteria bacterium]|nr:threonine/serine dehydratase [Alphaproteobacteria bacterium]
MPEVIPRSAIEAAYERIRGNIRRTPIMTLSGAEAGHDTDVVLKLECLQHAGSFKARGAFNGLLGVDVPEAGVVAASGGNHGAAVAYAASTLGHQANIFVPEISSPAKINLIQTCGAEVHVTGARYADALAASEELQASTGAMTIHAYNQASTLEGQGTLGLELEGQAPDLDTLLIAVGGGGLIGGVASWYRDRIKIVGVEPETSCCLHAGLEAGEPVTVKPEGVAADSLGASSAGDMMFPIAQAYVDHVALVSDAAITATQRCCWQNLRLASEPGGAAALAALLHGAYKPEPGERVGIVMCGANVELSKLDKLLT